MGVNDFCHDNRKKRGYDFDLSDESIHAKHDAEGNDFKRTGVNGFGEPQFAVAENIHLPMGR